MKTRVISAVIMIVLTFGCMAWCRISRVVFITAVGVLACREMANALRTYSVELKETDKTGEPLKPFFRTKWLMLACSMVGMGALICFHVDVFLCIAWYFLSIFAILFADVVSKNFYIPERGRNAVGNLFCLVYPSMPVYLILYLSTLDEWPAVFLIPCVATWICDTFALLGGMTFGKHKMAAILSPKKTWEGAFCGGLSSLAAGIVSYYLLIGLSSFGQSVKPVALLPILVASLVGSTFGQVGDLIASLFKRMAGLKDYSKLIPGHGGVMDRIDSLLFSIPAAYFVLLLFHAV